VEELLELFLELIGLLLAQIVEPGFVAAQRRRRERLIQRGVGDLVELKLKENQVGRDLRQLFRAGSAWFAE
jgi:hypothetical protein